MRDARFTIPTAGLLQKAVDGLDLVPMEDRDTKGDVYFAQADSRGDDQDALERASAALQRELGDSYEEHLHSGASLDAVELVTFAEAVTSASVDEEPLDDLAQLPDG